MIAEMKDVADLLTQHVAPPDMAMSFLRVAGENTRLREILRFAVQRFCDPAACDTDPASVRLAEMGAEFGIRFK